MEVCIRLHIRRRGTGLYRRIHYGHRAHGKYLFSTLRVSIPRGWMHCVSTVLSLLANILAHPSYETCQQIQATAF